MLLLRSAPHFPVANRQQSFASPDFRKRSLLSQQLEERSSYGGGGSHRRTCLCFAFPCCGGKYREFWALEAGYGEAALALANKFKSFPPDSLTFGTGNFAERTANCTYRNKESFLRLAKGVGTKLTYRGAELATDGASPPGQDVENFGQSKKGK